MTLLLKNVWRTLLRGSPVSITSFRSMNASVSEITTQRPTDAMMVTIKTAPSVSTLLSAIQMNVTYLTHKHMVQALKTLFEMHKAGTCELEVANLIQDPGFGVLCQNIKKHARALEVTEAIEVVKVLSYLQVPADSLIVQTMLQIIRCQINTLNLRQIMFLDFIFSKFDTKNHLIDALKLALPLAFQIHLPLELDNEDFPLLKEMLVYCCTHDLPDRCINNVITGLLLHDQEIDAKSAKSIIWSLTEINCTEERFPTRVQLLHICYDILTLSINMLTYDEVLRTAAKIKGRVLEKHPEYYHEQLMDAVADYVVVKNIPFEKSLLVARVLSRIAHTHLGLVDHLCQQAVSNPVTLTNARTNLIFGFVNCLSNSNYTPEHEKWTEIKKQISKNPVLDVTSVALPWTKFCLELASLGVYEDKLLNRVFSKEFLNSYLEQEASVLDYLQLLTLHEAVRTFHSNNYSLPPDVLEKAKSLYPTHSMNDSLVESLARGLGGPEYVTKNVVLPSGIIADIVVCLKGGYPIKLPAVNKVSKILMEQLNLPENAIVICLMNFNQGCYSMNSNRLRGSFRLILDILESNGYAAVAVNINEWMKAPSHEWTPYLMRELGYKCGEFGMKLCAT